MLGGSPKTPKQPRHRVLPFPSGANRESFGKFAAMRSYSRPIAVYFFLRFSAAVPWSRIAVGLVVLVDRSNSVTPGGFSYPLWRFVDVGPWTSDFGLQSRPT